MTRQPFGRRKLLASAWLPLLAQWPARAWAQAPAWPAAPMKIVVPLPAGGGVDAGMRILADVLKRRLGQPVIVENKPGASGLLGLKAVSQAPADGLSLVYLISAHVTLDLLTSQLDLLREFEPVSAVSSSPFVVLVKADSPYRSLADLAAAARQAPGKLSFASGGPGSAIHIGMGLLNELLGVQMLHVPYKGGQAGVMGLAGGEVDVSMTIPAGAKPLLASGRLRPLCVTTKARLGALPDVPTVQEAVGKPFEYISWGGFAVRKGAPAQAVPALFAAVHEAVADPAYQEFMRANASDPALSATPADFSALIRRQYQSEGDLIRRLDIKLQ
jgi:tripartite-type tricarboxylate transporter receptor subunit TctC